MANSTTVGVIRADEAYAKRELMLRLGISQKFWDVMLDDGLPYTHVGHAKWVTGKQVIEFLERRAQHKNGNQPST